MVVPNFRPPNPKLFDLNETEFLDPSLACLSIALSCKFGHLLPRIIPEINSLPISDILEIVVLYDTFVAKGYSPDMRSLLVLIEADKVLFLSVLGVFDMP